MLRSMYSGISGLRNFQTKLDVIGNNIANVNTYGFKKGRVAFQDLMSQQLQGASSPTDNRGGTNPRQVGLGATIATIDTIMTQGSMQTTGRALDVGISGDGFFVVSDGNLNYYTRAGNFYLDQYGTLVNGEGLRVMGYAADANGNIDTSTLTTLQIAAGAQIAPQRTENVTFKGNLNADFLSPIDETTKDGLIGSSGTLTSIDTSTETIESIVTIINNQNNIPLDVQKAAASAAAKAKTAEEAKQAAINVISQAPEPLVNGNPIPSNATNLVKINYSVVDTLGGVKNIQLVLQKIDQNKWSIGVVDDTGIYYDLTDTADDAPDASFGYGTGNRAVLEFNSQGNLDLTNSVLPASMRIDPINGAAPFRIDLDFSKFTQFGGSNTADVDTIDGYIDGFLESFNIGQTGEITGVYSNGQVRVLGQIAVATFENPEGLNKAGNNTYQVSNNSGVANIGVPGEGRGTLMGASLEMSNVDLSEEFTEMIVAQRGFQANTRIITTSDEILQELVNLKR